MQQATSSTLYAIRLPVSSKAAGLFDGNVQVAQARPHPLLPGHIGLVDSHGVYYVVRLGEGGARPTVAAVYELQLCTGNNAAGVTTSTGSSSGSLFPQPVRQEWRAWEPLPDDEGLLLSHRGSGRILYAQLPLCEGERGAVCLFGAHEER
ncbi:hypothetical protein Agub_g9364 [Astrephomene gubernaculifera]|uniref:Uncharacterized protein n=1 Tax=Astrephomene gubernaculifera TaxID=47775 RepID=A0AAD3DT74_9CHLO|nr:hypothetical protein Agub_g9364 [Astrephomene gubernaculifera]